MTVDGLECQFLTLVLALSMGARRFVVASAPLLGKVGPADTCAGAADVRAEGEGGRVKGLGGFDRKVIGYCAVPVD